VGATFLYVTHDQEEALTMSDRIVVMRNGAIEQVGTPQEVYARPATNFVASFVGRANLFPGTVTGRSGDEAAVQLKDGPAIRVACPPAVQPGEEISVVARPEHMRLRPGRPTSSGTPDPELAGRVLDVTFAGNLWRYGVDVSSSRIEVHSTRRASVSEGDDVVIVMQPSDAWTVPQQAPQQPKEAETAQHGAIATGSADPTVPPARR
jgi:ABC-type Fe3+/spermidine/putrescine transport system ATPase subunit